MLSMSSFDEQEARVLATLSESAKLDLAQVAGSSRLSLAAATEALDGLMRSGLVSVSKGRSGLLYGVNREAVTERAQAA